MTEATETEHKGPWYFDTAAMTAVEMGQAVRELGIRPSQYDEYIIELMTISAVQLRRREDPSIPLSTWRTIRYVDLEPAASAAEDPTVPS